MIRDSLIPLIESRFAGRYTISDPGVQPCVTFPAVHSDVGDVEIHDDGDEITLIVGNFTHGHFSNYDEIPQAEREKEIAEDVIDFLSRLFADQVVLWGSHKGGGGWRVILDDTDDSTTNHAKYVWSGPRKS